MSGVDDDDDAMALEETHEAAQPAAQAQSQFASPQAAVRLHPEPPRVMRLSRKAIAGLTTFICLGGGGALIYGLHTDKQGAPQELYNTSNRATAESVSRAAKDYSQVPAGVPVIGPKLPGDLGRAIVANGLQGNGGQMANSANIQRQEREAAQQRMAQEHDAARSSRLFFGGAVASGDAASETASSPSMPASGNAPQVVSGTSATNTAEDAVQNGQSGKRAFLSSPTIHKTLASGRVTAPADPNVVQAGTIIPAALITGIRSDLPGQITAQVTENVYDSPTGRILLIPQGARLIGSYDSDISFGQNRVLLAWDRLILPGGRSIVLDRQPSGDAAGFAGIQDGVNQHWGSIIKAALVSTVLGAGTELTSGNGSDALTTALTRGSVDSLNQSGQQIVRRQLNIQPTLTIRPGFPLRVIVTRDLILEAQGDAP